MPGTDFLAPIKNDQSWKNNILSFIKPKRYFHYRTNIDLSQTVAIIPTYKPGIQVYKLVKDLVRWNKNMWIIVVNDCSPQEYDLLFQDINKLSEKVSILKTPKNKLKAGVFK